MREGLGTRGAGEVGGASTRRERVMAWLVVALWVAVIVSFSQGSFSAEWSQSRFIGPLIRLLGLSPEAGALVHLLIRKGAHLFEYAVLGFAALRATRLSLASGPAAVCALALALAVAGADEIHQATEPTRTGTPRDVALDLAGAALGVLVRSRFRAPLR